MPNYRKCGQPLYTGNVQVIRKPGKRNRREHRKCPEKTVHITDKPPYYVLSENIRVKPEIFTGKPAPDMNQVHSWGKGTADGPQRPQDNTGGPIIYTGIYTIENAPQYRFVMTRDQADRVKAAVERNLPGFGVSFEVIPVLEQDVEREPDRYADLVELTINWEKGE